MKLIMKHTTRAGDKVTERVFGSLQDAKNYKNAVVRNMCRGRKWILAGRSADIERWVTVCGVSALTFYFK